MFCLETSQAKVLQESVGQLIMQILKSFFFFNGWAIICIDYVCVCVHVRACV